jgi:hypothetical protein
MKMNIVKEYSNEKTKIRIHDDYIDTNEEKKIKEIIISLMISQLKNDKTLL